MAVRWIQIDPSSIDPSDRDSLPEQPGSGEVVLVALSAQARSDEGAEQALIELAREWARDHGRLVLMDLNLEGARLHTLLDEPRGQGVADVILFGASVASIARQPAGEMFLFATAGVPVADSTEVLTSERWGGIVRAFRDAGVTLVLAGALEDSGMEGLAALADLGVLLSRSEEDTAALLAPLPGQLFDAGDVPAAAEAGSPTGPGWARAETPLQSSGSEATPPVAAVADEDTGPVGAEVPGPRPTFSGSQVLTAASRDGGLPRWSVWAAGVAVVLALFWGLGKMGVLPPPFGSGGPGEGETPQFVEGVRAPEGGSTAGEAGEAGAGTDAAGGDAAASPTGTPAEPGTSGDGTVTSTPGAGGVEVPLGYSVGLASYESEAEALAVTADLGTRVSEPQFIAAPVEVNGRVYWRVLAGPVQGIQDAEGLRSTLPPRLGYASGSAWVIHWTPMAFLLAQAPSLAQARATAASLRSSAIPAYVLEGTSGGGSRVWRVYAGAYSSAEEASVLAQRLREVQGTVPDLVRRTGLPPR
jgi:cell division septation protein DedD